MKYKVIKAKKAGIASTLSDFWSYVIFVFVVIIFFAFFKIQSSQTIENKIKGLETEIGADITLINYLKTPIKAEISGQIREITIGDILVEYHAKREFSSPKGFNSEVLKKILSESNEELFNEKFKNLGWKIIITDDPNTYEYGRVITKRESDLPVDSGLSLVDRLSSSCMELPNLNPDETKIKVTLHLINLDASPRDLSIFKNLNSLIC